MANEASKLPADGPSPAVRLLMAVLALLALCGAAYLAYASLSRASVAGCGMASGCAAVLASRWAKLGPMPVALPAVGLYLALLIGLVSIRAGARRRTRRWAWRVMVTGAAAAGGAALWFIGLQLIWLQAICPFCMAVHVAALMLAGLVLLFAPIGGRAQGGDGDEAGEALLSPQGVTDCLLIALVGVAALIGGQYAFPGKTHKITLFEAAVVIDPQQYPLVGDPRSGRTVVNVYNYHCAHCRAMHEYLKDARRAFDGELAVVYMPTAFIGQDPSQARLAVAVFLTRPEAFEAFDDWLMSGDQPRGTGQSQARAAQLLGEDVLEEALADPRVDRIINDGYTVYKRSGAEALPVLIIGGKVLSGRTASAQVLIDELREYLPAQ